MPLFAVVTFRILVAMAQLLGDMIPESNARTMYEISQELDLDPVHGETHARQTFRLAAMRYFQWAIRDGNLNGWTVDALDDDQLSHMANAWMLHEHSRFASMLAQMSHKKKEEARV